MMRQIIESAGAEAFAPTGNPTLDHLFAEYNERLGIEDVPHYYRFLYRLSRQVPGLTMAELGCKHGAASLHFLAGGGKRAMAADTSSRVRWELFKGFDLSFYHQTSTSDVAVEAGRLLKPDIIFIDTDHTYTTTAEEFRLWRPLLASGGVILFDDIGHPAYGCTRFWQELPGNKIFLPHLHAGGWGFGVWLGEE